MVCPTRARFQGADGVAMSDARITYVIGPDGAPLTVADLPAPDTKRWVIRRKADQFSCS